MRALAQLLAAAADRLEIEEANRALFSGAGEAMLLIDAQGRCLDANPAAELLFGRSRDELLVASPAELIPAEQVEESQARVARLAQGETLSGSSVLRRPDGERRLVEWNTRGNLLPGRHLAIVRDVIERRRLEEQLARAQRLESVGQLAAGVAHDFNNLLTAIIGYADFADRETDNAQLQTQLEGVRAAATNGAVLTRQLLAIGRSRVVRASPTDLGALLHEMETLLRRTLPEDIELVIRADTVLVVLVDPAEIQQVTLNLALNARDAMPEGGTLRLTAAPAFAAGR